MYTPKFMTHNIDTGMIVEEQNKTRVECCHACYRRLVFAANKFYCQMCGRQGLADSLEPQFGFSERRWKCAA